MYHIYNTDDLTVSKIPLHKVKEHLTGLENKGAVFSLDIDNYITYSFEDDFESIPIQELLEKAVTH